MALVEGILNAISTKHYPLIRYGTMFDFSEDNRNAQRVHPLAKKRKKKSRSPRQAFVIVLLIIALLAGGWWVWRGLYPPAPRFNSMLISMNQELHKILPGETITLHASDKVRIHEISTNILLNINVRLASEGFDIDALRHEEVDLSALLPDKNIFEHYKFQVFIKYQNKDIGHIVCEIKPYAENWIEKANRTIDDKKRLAILEHGLSTLPDDSNLWQKLLDEYKSQKQWKKAASMLEETANKDPNEEVLNKLLEVYAAMSSKKKIISVLEKLIKLDPEDLSSRYQLAELYEKIGYNKSATTQYLELLKRADKRDRLPIYKSLGYIYSKRGINKRAISYYLKATKLDRKDANLYYNLSYLYEKTKQKEQADIYLEKAVRLNSKDVGARLELAQKLINKGDLKKAEKYITEILKKKPSSLEALMLKAKVAEKRGQKKELEKIYKKIYSLDKKNETVMYNLGVLNYEKGNLKSSLNYFTKYIEKKPNDAAAHGIIFNIYRSQNNDKKAFEEAKILVKLTPDNADVYNYIFAYLKNRNDFQNIISIMKRGLKAKPNQTNLKKHLLFAYLKTGKDDQAIKVIEGLLKTNPEDIDLLIQLAGIYEKNKNFPEALETYKKIIKISPDHEKAEEAYLRLRLKGVREK